MLTQTGTISSKGQVTLPAKMLRSINVDKGDRIIFEVHDDQIKIIKAKSALDKLAGALYDPK